MQASNFEDSRAETITAALIYLMSHHARTGCPRLAVCVARHMQCLALHPDSPQVVRDICAALHGPWQEQAELRQEALPGQRMH